MNDNSFCLQTAMTEWYSVVSLQDNVYMMHGEMSNGTQLTEIIYTKRVMVIRKYTVFPSKQNDK